MPGSVWARCAREGGCVPSRLREGGAVVVRMRGGGGAAEGDSLGGAVAVHSFSKRLIWVLSGGICLVGCLSLNKKLSSKLFSISIE